MNPTTAGDTSVRPVEQSSQGALSVVDPRSGGGLATAARHGELIQAATSVPATSPAVAIDPKAILSSVRRRWFLALSLGLFTGGVAAGIAWFAIPDSYVAFSEIKILATPKKLLFETMTDRGMTFNIFRQSQMRQLTGPFVLQAAMREKDIAGLEILKDEPHPQEWLEQNLSISTPATEFIRVSLRGRNPDDLAKIVNAVTNAYINEVADVESSNRKKRRTELEKARESLKAKLKLMLNRQKRLVEETGASSEVAMSQAELALVEYYSKLRSRLADLEFDRSRLEFQLGAVREGHSVGQDPGPIPPDVLEARVMQEPSVVKAQQEADRLAQALATLKTRISDPTKKPLMEAEAANTRAQNNVEIEKNKAREVVTTKIRDEFSKNSELTVSGLESQVKHCTDEIADLKRKLEQAIQNRKATAVHTLELASLQKEILRDERIENQIADELSKIGVEEQSGEDAAARISLFRKADTPHSPDMSKKVRIVGLAGGGGLAVVVLGILWLDLRTRRINTLEEVAGGLRLPVLGLLPSVPRRIASSHDPNSGAQGVWQGTLMESVDAARVMLLRRAQLEQAKVAMVVSAVASEGKTTLACHLATSLARSGHKTLLVDADMRRPTVHRVFELPNEPGLCELLRSESELPDVVIPTAQDGLYLVPAGQLTHEALRELAQDGLGKIVKRMRDEYDFVIFDSSPILPVTDSLMLSKHIDGSIVSIRRDVSQYPKVASACQRLAAMGVPIWGAVVIGLGHPAYGYRYAYTYGTNAKK